MYGGWTQTDYQNKHYNMNQKDQGTWDDRGRDGVTNFVLSIKEQETRLILHEHVMIMMIYQVTIGKFITHISDVAFYAFAR